MSLGNHKFIQWNFQNGTKKAQRIRILWAFAIVSKAMEILPFFLNRLLREENLLFVLYSCFERYACFLSTNNLGYANLIMMRPTPLRQ